MVDTKPTVEKQDVEMIEELESNHEKSEQDSLRARLRVNVDGREEDEVPFKLNPRLVLALMGCSIAFAGSQLIPLSYFTLYTYIARQLGATNFVWLKAANWTGQIASACTLGPLSDLLGRKVMFLAGIFIAMIGMVLCASTPNASGFIAGQALAGFGLMAEELLALAVTAELVPTSKRAVYGAAMIAGFVPWAPGALYAQLIAQYNWRWIGCMIALWHLLALGMIGFFYSPPPRVLNQGVTTKEIIQKIDIVGIALGITGFVVFLVGLNWGGQTYAWNSYQVLVALCMGVFTVLLFVAWEAYGAKYPLFPRRLVQVRSSFWAIMTVIFMAGINYVPLAIFWPIESISVFNSNHKETGINTVPVGLCILGGAIISAGLCGRWPKHCRLIMTVFCIMQTAGVGCMAAIDPQNINTAWPPVIIGLVGIGGVLFPNQIIVTCITPDDLLATVTSLTFVIRGVSQSVALALLQNRFQANVVKYATPLVGPAAIRAGFTSVAAIKEMISALTAVPFKEYVPTVLPNITPANYDALHLATVQTFGKSFPTLYYIGLGFGVVGCVASVLVGDMSKYMDEHVAVMIH